MLTSKKLSSKKAKKGSSQSIHIFYLPFKLNSVSSIKKILNKLEGFNLKENFNAFEKKICEHNIKCNNIKEIQKKISNIKKDFFIFVGGNHLISLPIVKELSKKEKFGVIWIDAHADLRSFHPGTFNKKYANTTVLRRIYEFNKNIVIIGLRSCSRQEKEFYEKNKIPVFKSWDINKQKIKKIIKNKKWYLSIDIDVLDPVYAPSVTYPEPFGLSLKELAEIIRLIFKGSNIISCDLVEIEKNNDITSISAAKIIELLLIFSQKY